MDIAAAWGKTPGWVLEQPREVIADLIAWHRVKTDPSGAARKKRVGTVSQSGAEFWGLGGHEVRHRGR